MKIVRGAGDEVLVMEAFNVVSFDGDDVVEMLEAAGDEQERFLGNDEAEFLEELRVDDGIRNPGFIFEADEHKAFGRTGTLAADDVAGDSHDLVVPRLREI